MPTVSVATIVRWRGSRGYSAGVIPTATIRNAANTDFVTNSLVTRWMLRRIRRPSATMPGMAAKSPFTSTTSATALAICVPEPCAIDSRDAFSAGTSLTPSPTIATYRPRRRSDSTTRRFPSGEIRPTRPSSRTTRSSSVVAGRKRAAVDSAPRAGIPASCAIEATVRAESPERTTISTPCSTRYATVPPCRPGGPRPVRRDRGAEAGAARRPDRRGTGSWPCRTRPPDDRPPAGRHRPPRAPRAERARGAEDVSHTVESQATPAAARDERDRLTYRLRTRRRGTRESLECQVLRLGRGGEAAERVCEPGLLGRGGRDQGDDARDASVKVPVLSTQIVSTDASDSIAFSCCESAPALAMRSAAAA